LDILGRCSHLPIVVDHLGLPEPGSTADAARRLTELARFAQCRLKIAGFARISADAPPYRQSWSLVGHALQEFGASRLLWGSDFPHPDSEAGYAASVAAMVSIPSMTREQRDRIMGGTSRELWRLPAEAAVR
jgi:L-fuconolactonase